MKKILLILLALCGLTQFELIAASRSSWLEPNENTGMMWETMNKFQHANFEFLVDTALTALEIQEKSFHYYSQTYVHQFFHSMRADFFNEILNAFVEQNTTAKDEVEFFRIFNSVKYIIAFQNGIWKAYEKYLEYRLRDLNAPKLLKEIQKIDAELAQKLTLLNQGPLGEMLANRRKLSTQAKIKKGEIFQQMETIITGQPPACSEPLSQAAVQIQEECSILIAIANASLPIYKIPTQEIETLKKLNDSQKKALIELLTTLGCIPVRNLESLVADYCVGPPPSLLALEPPKVEAPPAPLSASSPSVLTIE